MSRTLLRPLKYLASLAACALLSAAAGPSTITITQKGVGPIKPTTHVDVTTFKRLFPGYDVKKGEEHQEDTKVADTVEVSWKGRTVLIAHTTAVGTKTIRNVEVLSPEVAGPHGIRVGASFADLFKLGALNCRRGIEQLDSFIFCFLPSESGLIYEGNIDELTPADGYDPTNRTPPPTVLAKMRVHGILWRPPL